MTVGSHPLFAARECKDDLEAKAIRTGNAASAAGIRLAEKVLRDSVIEGNPQASGRTLTQNGFVAQSIARLQKARSRKHDCRRRETGLRPA